MGRVITLLCNLLTLPSFLLQPVFNIELRVFVQLITRVIDGR